jgi:hypothetical protein
VIMLALNIWVTATVLRYRKPAIKAEWWIDHPSTQSVLHVTEPKKKQFITTLKSFISLVNRFRNFEAKGLDLKVT